MRTQLHEGITKSKKSQIQQHYLHRLQPLQPLERLQQRCACEKCGLVGEEEWRELVDLPYKSSRVMVSDLSVLMATFEGLNYEW